MPALRRPRPLWPLAIERAYEARLVRRATAAKHLLDERLLALLRQLAPDIDARAAARADSAGGTVDPEAVIAVLLAPVAARRMDAADDDLAALLRVVESTRRAFTTAWEPAAADLTGVGEQVAMFNAKQASRTYPTLYAIPIARTPADAALIRVWGTENAALIRTIDSRYFDDIRDVIEEAVRKGTQTSEIATLLRERYGVSKSRARLIARDQIGKLNSKINETRATRLGITRYEWSTSHDERVRPTHRNLDGTIHSYAEPPVSEPNGQRNHPGGAIQCRCVALPVFDDEEDVTPTPFTSPRLGGDRTTIYGSREDPLTREQGADLDKRLGRAL